MNDAAELYSKERDEVLLSGDVDRLMAFHAKHFPDQPPKARNVVEMAMHKSRTALVTLPMEARRFSKRWLAERGLRSHDDGDV